MTDDHTCGADLRRFYYDQGVEVTVSTEPPLVRGPYSTDAFICHHGVAYFAEPTGEQIAAWARDGVA